MMQPRTGRRARGSVRHVTEMSLAMLPAGTMHIYISVQELLYSSYGVKCRSCSCGASKKCLTSWSFLMSGCCTTLPAQTATPYAAEHY